MLSKICFEQIRDNYYHGQYGNFSAIINKETGYVNATKLCNDGGKKFYHWSDSKVSKELIIALKQQVFSEALGEHCIRDVWSMIPYNPVAEVVKQVFTKNQTNEDKLIAGTYIHPLLIPHVACWVSPAFALKAGSLINNFITDEWKHKLEVAQQLQKDLEMEVNSLQSQNLELQDSANDWHEIADHNLVMMETKAEAVDNLEAKVCEQIRDKHTWSSTHAFTILCINDVESTCLPYYAIRCRRKAVCQSIKKLRHKHPKAEVIHQEYKVPNAINLFERLKKQHAIETKRNYFSHLLADEGKLFHLVSSLCGTSKSRDVAHLNAFREM